MLHAMFQGHIPFGSGEDFKGGLKYMDVAEILVMLPRCPQIRSFPRPMDVPLAIWLELTQRLEKMYDNNSHKHVHRDRGRQLT